jgi:TRAP-type mannitol/chloroaromatic compound transport system permease large subunit
LAGNDVNWFIFDGLHWLIGCIVNGIKRLACHKHLHVIIGCMCWFIDCGFILTHSGLVEAILHGIGSFGLVDLSLQTDTILLGKKLGMSLFNDDASNINSSW